MTKFFGGFVLGTDSKCRACSFFPLKLVRKKPLISQGRESSHWFSFYNIAGNFTLCVFWKNQANCLYSSALKLFVNLKSSLFWHLFSSFLKMLYPWSRTPIYEKLVPNFSVEISREVNFLRRKMGNEIFRIFWLSIWSFVYWTCFNKSKICTTLSEHLGWCPKRLAVFKYFGICDWFFSDRKLKNDLF